MISNMTIEMERKRSCGSCLRYCMIVVNIVFAVSDDCCFMMCQINVVIQFLPRDTIHSFIHIYLSI